MRIAFILIFFLAIASSTADVAVNAYGEDVEYGGTEAPNTGDDQGALSDIGSGLEGIVGASLGAFTGFLDFMMPADTDIWVIDNWVLEPLSLYFVYWGVVLARGGGDV